MSDSNSKAPQGIEGVFSNQEVRKVGTGTTTRKTIHKSFWYAVEQPGGEIEVQPLNSNYIPSGPKKRLSKDEFLATFSPEPEFYVSNVLPKVKDINKTLARADRHRKNKEYFSAEMEYGNALQVDEENIRANFGLGITYLERGETGKADDILARLVRLDGAFEPEHKHLYNEFGINLRKKGLFDQSIAYYSRALELSCRDENLFYNLSRACLEKKDAASSLKYLLQGLNINPLQETLLSFLEWMVSKGLVPDSEKDAVIAILQRVKELRAEREALSAPEASELESAEGEKSEGGGSS